MKHVSIALAIVLIGGALLGLSTCSQGGRSLGWKIDLGADLDRAILQVASLKPEDIPVYLNDRERSDSIADYASTPQGRKEVLDFFTEIAGSPSVSRAILDNSVHYGVSPALALALAHEESRFDVRAVNRNPKSVDRGLFQLNSLAFPEVKGEDAWDPEISARYGISHLAWFLETGGNEVAALAMYNAGRGKVDSGGTPRRTLDYIYRIQSYRDNILNLFTARVAIRSSARVGGLGSPSGAD